MEKKSIWKWLWTNNERCKLLEGFGTNERSVKIAFDTMVTYSELMESLTITNTEERHNIEVWLEVWFQDSCCIVLILITIISLAFKRFVLWFSSDLWNYEFLKSRNHISHSMVAKCLGLCRHPYSFVFVMINNHIQTPSVCQPPWYRCIIPTPPSKILENSYITLKKTLLIALYLQMLKRGESLIAEFLRNFSMLR